MKMSREAPPFFTDELVANISYVNIRDHPRGVESKNFVENLWRQFHPYADSSFLDDARNHFHQRFWEMYLGVTLMKKGFALTKHGDDGPEFSVQIGEKKVWFEAIAPSAGIGPDHVPELVMNECRQVPVERILLRFTNALAEKKRRYTEAVAEGIIDSQDAYILAINSRGIPSAPYENTMPYFVRAFLPFGPLAVAIDPKTGGVVDSFYQYRPNIEKSNGAKVSTSTFLDSEATFCSAVIHSAVDCANYPVDLGGDFAVLHNPQASFPVSEESFRWCTQFKMCDDQLHRSNPSS